MIQFNNYSIDNRNKERISYTIDSKEEILVIRNKTILGEQAMKDIVKTIKEEVKTD